MKKLILLLIALTTLTNVSYASFPVADHLEVHQKSVLTEDEESKSNGNLYVFFSILSAIGILIFSVLALANGLAHNGNPFPFLILALASIGATIVSTIKAKKHGAKWGKSLLGLGIGVVGVLLLLLLVG